MNRFLLASSKDNGQTAVIQTINPVAIIEVIPGHGSCKHFSKQFFVMPENKPVTLALIFIASDIDTESKEKLLTRAFHWYNSKI